jgi:biotin-(acetyl-CoA carboxylase) ligase
MVYPVALDGAEGYRARALAITDDAALVVETADGERRSLSAGEVRLALKF